jgi:DNA-binding LacI/PurR family transcriptional regulator
MPTIEDVARLAGVSISTVSYALSGKRPISEATRLRVTAAAESLDYRPNAAARSLASARTYILAIDAPLPPARRFLSVHMIYIHAVGKASRELGYDVLLLTRDEGVSGLRRLASTSLVDGVVILDVSLDDPRAALVRSLDLPAAWIGTPADVRGLHCVDVDFEGAAEMVVERLARLGHTCIALIGYPQSVYDRRANYAQRFKDAFERTAERYGVAVSFRPGETDRAAIAETMDQLFAEQPGLTAIVSNSIEPTPQIILELLDERGLRRPQDISMISVGSVYTTDEDVDDCDFIPWPAEEVSKRAVEIALEQVCGSREPSVELLAPRYVDRGTTAAPKARTVTGS